MREQMKQVLKDLGIIILQILGLLALIFIGFYLVGALIIFAALSRM